MSGPIIRLAQEQMLARASSAIGKVDAYELRGVTMLSIEEIEAMALLLASLGLVATKPGGAVPPAFFLSHEGSAE